MPLWHESERERIAVWLKEIPKPIALYAVADNHAVPVLQICRNEGIAVPEEIAVLGVENDEWFCRLCHPPLSSVEEDGYRIGYEAAKLLQDRMEHPKKRGTRNGPMPIPPLYIATRQSTDCMMIEDRDVVETLHFIRENACNGLTVDQVVRHSNLSHRTLARLFGKWTGRTIEQEIKHIRIDRAKHLLKETTFSITLIGKRTGFKTTEYFCHVFRKETGLSPKEFRLQKRPELLEKLLEKPVPRES